MGETFKTCYAQEHKNDIHVFEVSLILKDGCKIANKIRWDIEDVT